MGEKNLVKVMVKMVANFDNATYEETVPFYTDLLVKDEVTQRSIMEAFLNKLQGCLGDKSLNTIFVQVDNPHGGSCALNLNRVNYFSISDWSFEKGQE